MPLATPADFWSNSSGRVLQSMHTAYSPPKQAVIDTQCGRSHGIAGGIVHFLRLPEQAPCPIEQGHTHHECLDSDKHRHGRGALLVLLLCSCWCISFSSLCLVAGLHWLEAMVGASQCSNQCPWSRQPVRHRSSHDSHAQPRDSIRPLSAAMPARKQAQPANGHAKTQASWL